LDFRFFPFLGRFLIRNERLDLILSPTFERFSFNQKQFPLVFQPLLDYIAINGTTEQTCQFFDQTMSKFEDHIKTARIGHIIIMEKLYRERTEEAFEKQKKIIKKCIASSEDQYKSRAIPIHYLTALKLNKYEYIFENNVDSNRNKYLKNIEIIAQSKSGNLDKALINLEKYVQQAVDRSIFYETVGIEYKNF
jgi:hypothetical protein